MPRHGQSLHWQVGGTRSIIHPWASRPGSGECTQGCPRFAQGGRSSPPHWATAPPDQCTVGQACLMLPICSRVAHALATRRDLLAATPSLPQQLQSHAKRHTTPNTWVRPGPYLYDCCYPRLCQGFCSAWIAFHGLSWVLGLHQRCIRPGGKRMGTVSACGIPAGLAEGSTWVYQ